MRLLTLSLLMVAMTTQANTETDYRNNVQWAKDAIGNTQNKSEFRNFDVYSFCADEACKQQVANPNEKRYQDNPSALSDDAAREAARNEQSQAVTASFNKGRPAIDPNDPAYRAAIGYQDDAYNISHGISSKYHDCEKGLRCDVGTVVKTCTVPTNNPVQCYLTPDVSTITSSKVEHSFVLSGESPFTINLPNTSAVVTGLRFAGTFTTFGYPTALTVALNGVKLGSVPVSSVDNTCESLFCQSSINGTLNVDHHQSGQAVIVHLGARYLGADWDHAIVTNLPITVITAEKNIEIGTNNSCGALLPECQQVSSQCTEGKETRVINGISVTLDCWKEQLTYQCNTPNTCASLPECIKQSSACDTLIEGVCITQKEQRQCEVQQCQDVGLVCGEDSFALSGDFYDPDIQKSTDFNSAAAGLAAVGEAGQDVANAANVTDDSPIIFKGTAMSCTDKPIGMSNCCQDGGWGTDIGITKCSEEEKALGDAKDKKITVSLGQYCAEKVLGVCIRKKKSYCAFDSMLARIVQEDGRPQLGLNFGTPKHPNCSALSPKQLQQINMDNMDFSDFYSDMLEGANIPDPKEIIDRLTESVGGKR